MKDLKSNVTSRYWDAANRMRPKYKKRKVIAYVESYDDIFFWRSILSEYETDSLKFEVVLPSRTSLSRGKKSAMMNRLGNNLGTSMIACVDADYDYLMQGSTPFSRDMLSNPYIVHSYAYAIENFQCYAPSLHNVCVMATLNDRPIFDFEAYLTTYSEIVYDLFVWSVWIHRYEQANAFSLTAFANVASVNKLNVFNPMEALDKLRHAVNRKMAWLQRQFPQAKGKLKPLKAELERLGVTPSNVYLYIQGHHLMDNVVMTVLNPVCNILRREREKDIKRLAEHTQQMDNELSSYQHSQCSVESMIRRNTAFRSALPYRMLQDRVKRLVDMIEGRSEAHEDALEDGADVNDNPTGTSKT